MAGDWIKVEHATPDKPEVWKLAELLGCSPNEALGLLIRMWIWFDQQSVDGNAGGVTGVTLMKRLDALLSRPGFAKSLEIVGWLTADGMPNFDYHNGESAKKRALTQKRVKKHRKEKRNVDVTATALPEKRREEITTSEVALPDWLPIEPWNAFVEMRRAIRASLTSKAKVLAIAKLAKLRAEGYDARELLDAAVMNSWRSFYPPKGGPANAADGKKRLAI